MSTENGKRRSGKAGESAGEQHRQRPPAPRSGNGNLRPPWKPGESGNPAGRPKGKTLTELLRERLEALAADVPFAADLSRKLGADPDAVTVAHVLVDAALLAAAGGDAALIHELWDRLEGRVPSRIANADGGPVELAPIVLDGEREL